MSRTNEKNSLSKFNHKFIILFCILSTPLVSYGQSFSFDSINFETVQFKHLTAEQGLAHDRVHAAIMDEQGYMWFGTQDGLSRWDGLAVKTYYPRLDDSTSISGSLVTDLAMDKDGFLWIVSHQGDLCRYDASTDQFKTFHYPAFDNGIVLTSEMEVFIDSDEIIWIGAFDDGFVRFDPELEIFRQFDVIQDLNKDDDRVRKNSVLVITEDKIDKNILWLGTNNGLFSFDKNKRVVSSHSSDGSPGGAPAIRGIHRDDNDNLWLATLGSGIAQYNLKSRSWSYFVPNEEMWKAFNFGVNYIHDIEYKSDNEFWIASGEYGSGVFNTQDKSFTFFESNLVSPTAIRSNKAFEVYIDPNGTVWFMHDNSGVSYLEPTCQIFHFKDFNLPNEQSSWNRFLADFTYDENNEKVYGVGHVRNGLFEIDHQSGNIKRIAYKGFEGSMNEYDAILQTSFGELLIGGFNGANASYGNQIYSPLSFLDKKEQLVKPFRPEKLAKLQSKNINDLHEDSNKNIWIATDDGYLFCYNHEEDTIREYYLTAKHGTGINYIVEDNSRRQLYCATFDGIYKFDLVGFSFEVIQGTKEFSSRGITLSQDSDLLWIGTRQLGVQCYDIERNELLPINEYRNAPRTPVEKVFLDNNDQLWATTERGVYLLNYELEMFYNFSAQNGISQDFFYSQNVFMLKDGTVILGQQGGYYYFDPQDLKASLVSGPAVITDVLINKEEVSKDRDENGHFKFDLPYDQNTITIGISSISYCQQDKVLFSYMLEGLEEDWIIPINNSRTINYPSLSPGSYTFKVKKIDKNEDKIESMEININPPWWRSIFAFLAYGLFVIYGINWIYSLKLRRQKEKEELRLKISSDIHDDVGSLLAGLSMQSETMALVKEGEEKENLLEISNTGREAIERLRDIVWALDSRRDKYENLIDRMKHFADSKFRHTKFDYSFNIGKFKEQKFISPDNRQNIYLVFKEAITNLIKHSNGDKAVVSFDKQGSNLVLSVYDNGTENQISKSEGSGLTNMKMRAKKINGVLTVDNTEGFLVNLAVRI